MDMELSDIINDVTDFEDLQARYDSRKNFYGKAQVYHTKSGKIYLRSYDTIVSECENGVVKHYGKYSQTTSRHQKEFEKQFSR